MTTQLTAKTPPQTEIAEAYDGHIHNDHIYNNGACMPIDNLNPTFARRLIIAQLIHSQPRPCVPELMRLTGWPRRTLQDILKALPGLGLELEFVQDGIRNNAGYYQLNSWGPIDPKWVEQHRPDLYRLLELTLD